MNNTMKSNIPIEGENCIFENVYDLVAFVHYAIQNHDACAAYNFHILCSLFQFIVKFLAL